MNKQETILRENIRQAIRLVKKKKMVDRQKQLNEESQLRNLVKQFLDIEMKLISEAKTPDNDPAPHENTGINVLEDLLKKIIPILETDYKLLTTDLEQRTSFRSHVINAVVGTLTPVEANNDAALGGGELQEEVDIDVVDDDKFIDVRGETEPEEVEEDPRDEFGIEGADVTGRNMAYASFKKIESSIIDAYDLLSNAEDQELFYDYLIANLKLYFDKFEKELEANVSEPTNQAYDTAKEAEPEGEGGTPEGGEEEIEFEV
jgi:hypothetical protein